MQKLIRQLFSTLDGKLFRLFVPLRRVIELPIKITVEPDRNTGKLTLKKETFSLRGKTRDLSKTGLAFCVDSIRLQEHYLVGQERILNTEIDLPNGKVSMQIVGQRYEQIGEHLSVSKYLIGAVIVNMKQADRDIYDEYLQHGTKIKTDASQSLGLETTKG